MEQNAVRFPLLIASALLVMGSSGCAGRAATMAASVNSAKPPAYTLGAGDRIRVSVYGEQAMNGEYAIGPSGEISLPLIGNVDATGKTVAQLQLDITHKLSPDYILDPKVSVDMVDYRPFYILGEVDKPGKYPYSSALTLQQAVATAGGFTYRASTSKIFLQRGDKGEVEVKLSKDKPFWILPGDTIRIGERYF